MTSKDSQTHSHTCSLIVLYIRLCKDSYTKFTIFLLGNERNPPHYCSHRQNFGFMTKKIVQRFLCYKCGPIYMWRWYLMILKSFVGKFWSYSLIKLTNFKSRFWTCDTCHVGYEGARWKLQKGEKNTCFWDGPIIILFFDFFDYTPPLKWP